MASLAYGLRVVLQRIQGRGTDPRCPYCESASRRVGYKKLLLALYECPSCHLRYRVPKGYASEASRYYNQDYEEPTVTELPSRKQVERREFDTYLKDRAPYLSCVLDELSPSSVLDYGSSWGYIVDWMIARGVEEAVGYEISRRHARFGRRNLGVSIYSALEELSCDYPAGFEMVYTAHVLEHLSDPSPAFEDFRKLLAPGGTLVVVVPNASDPALEANGHDTWAALVGEVHPLALSYPFFEEVLPAEGFYVEKRGPPDHPEVRIVARYAA